MQLGVVTKKIIFKLSFCHTLQNKLAKQKGVVRRLSENRSSALKFKEGKRQECDNATVKRLRYKIRLCQQVIRLQIRLLRLPSPVVR